MEIVTVLLLLLITYLVVNNKTAFNRKIADLELKILELKVVIERLRASRFTDEETRKTEEPKSIITPAPPVVKADEPINIPQPEPVAPPEIQPKPEPVLIKPDHIERQPEVISDSLSAIHRPVKTGEYTPPKPREPKPSFFESHPDLEKFIGENLINKIGIAILVLAIGFFVKYAIDNDWVGPIGRVGIGVVCGAILIGIAHRLRNSYKAFSSVLVGGGLAVFYFTITLAFHQFNLFSQTVAFIILIVITIFAVALSLLYDKQELAVIALVGGFASPFMVSTGHANYDALFIYLLILNTGLLVISYFKAWRVLNIISFVFTVIVFASVLYTLTAPSYHIGFIYASIFYVLYFIINVAHNVKENKKFIASDFTILLSNTALYFAAGLYLLTVMKEEQFRGLFCISLGVVNLVLSYVLFRNRKVDTNILYLLIGITLTFMGIGNGAALLAVSALIHSAHETYLAAALGSYAAKPDDGLVPDLCKQ